MAKQVGKAQLDSIDELSRRVTLLQGDVIRLIDRLKRMEDTQAEVNAATLAIYRRFDPKEANPSGVSL